MDIIKRFNDYFGEGGGVKVAILKDPTPAARGGLWYTKAPLAAGTPGYLRAQNAHGGRIVMIPADESRYLMCDDLTQEQVRTHHQNADGSWKPGRACVESSPGNFQVWVRYDGPLLYAQKTHLLHKQGADPGATPTKRHGVLPGYRNQKSKHEDERGGHPLVKLVHVDATRECEHYVKVSEDELAPYEKKTYRRLSITPGESLVQPGTVERASESPPQSTRSSCSQSALQQYTSREIHRHEYQVSGDESATDFRYALALSRRGIEPAEIASRIRSERTDWAKYPSDSSRDGYLEVTISKAVSVIESSPAARLNRSVQEQDRQQRAAEAAPRQQQARGAEAER